MPHEDHVVVYGICGDAMVYLMGSLVVHKTEKLRRRANRGNPHGVFHGTSQGILRGSSMGQPTGYTTGYPMIHAMSYPS